MNENMIWLIPDLCGTIVNIKNYSLCLGRLSNKCRRDQYCALAHLSDDQINYVLSDIGSDVYLNACPGSGKTEVIGVKCAYELSHWQSKSSGMAILTFTNSAEDEIRNRTISYLQHQIQYPHFLGTFTSWLHGYIANPFLGFIINKSIDMPDRKLKIIDSSCDSDFLSNFKTKYSYGKLEKIQANYFSYDIKIKKFRYNDGRENRNELEFANQYQLKNEYIEDDLKKTKSKFWRRNFFTYDDIEYLTYYLLKNKPFIAKYLAKRFPFVIIDECQDLSYVQLSILNGLHKYGTRIHLVGDLNQAIYSFRNIEPADTKSFINQNQFKEMRLIENYRSNQAIVDISGRVVNRKNYVVGKKEQTTNNPLVALLYKGGAEKELIQAYKNLLLQENIQSQNCCIIVRNTSLKKKLMGVKFDDPTKKPNIIEDFAHFVYLQRNTDAASFQEGLHYLSRAVQRSYFSAEEHENSISLYKPQCVDSKTWRQILLCVRKALVSSKDVLNLELLWGSWKNALLASLANVHHKSLGEYHIGILRSKVTNKKVIATFHQSTNSTQNCNLKIETIHGCKGRGFESVLFVSSSKSSHDSAGYWKNWFPQGESETSESTRLAYVAFSRAKQLLAVGIPTPANSSLDDADFRLIQDYGFKVYDCNTQSWVSK